MIVDTAQQVTQEAFATLVGISQQAVSDLVQRGVLGREQSVGAWLIAYTSHLREVAAGRAAAGELDLATERAALARAQREKIEMQNAVTRGELAPVILLEQVLTATAAKVAGMLDAIPGHVRRRVPELPAEGVDLIAGEIAKVRNTVASMSLEDITKEDGEDPDEPEIGTTDQANAPT